ncbi:hypothetical protein [Paenibacillus sp. HJGM_3]|uniref:hypothetical protein n=1 Tax=Paenibacillus sp. HJGM_3 TaxID=3379816 RepID=UPI00385C0BF0
MGLYDDHVSYAKKTRIPVSLAKVWCANQLELQEEMDAARVCPKCGKPTLVLESGSYEEGTQDYVYCANDEIQAVDVDGEEYFEECDYTADPEKKHEPLSTWYDFDVIWAFSCGLIDRKNEFYNLRDWLDFVRKEVAKITPKVSA